MNTQILRAKQTKIARLLKYEMKVTYKNDTWRILGLGVSDKGKTYCHLASTTQFIKQHNGERPKQVCVWIVGLPSKPKYRKPQA
jgi:hypothetical protein